jgi:cytoskeletal protein RodZ
MVVFQQPVSFINTVAGQALVYAFVALLTALAGWIKVKQEIQATKQDQHNKSADEKLGTIENHTNGMVRALNETIKQQQTDAEKLAIQTDADKKVALAEKTNPAPPPVAPG